MRRILSRMMSCLVATTMVITSAGVTVLAEELLPEDAVLSEDILLPADNDTLTDDNILLEGSSEMVIIDKPVTENKPVSDGSDKPATSDNSVSDKADVSKTSVPDMSDYQKILENDPGVILLPEDTSYSERYSGQCCSADGVSEISNDGISDYDATLAAGYKYGASSWAWPDRQLNDEERAFVIKRVKEIVAETITDDMSDIEKYYRLKSWMSHIRFSSGNREFYEGWSDEHTYKHDTPHGSYCALKYGFAVCQGKALLYSKLCHEAGLPCYEILTYDKWEHILNVIPNINDNSYYVDVDMCFLASDEADPSAWDVKFYKDYVDKNKSGLKTLKCSDDAFTLKSNSNPGKKRQAKFSFSYEMFYKGAIERSTELYSVYEFWAPYVERGSGISGVHHARYEDYALKNPRNTGNWELDDFFSNPKAQLPSMDKAAITGVKTYYDIDIYNDDCTINNAGMAALRNAVKDDLKVTYNGTALQEGADFTLSDGTADEINTGAVSYILTGKGAYGGTAYISTTANKLLNTEKITINTYAGFTKKDTRLAKGSSTAYSVTNTDTSVASLDTDGTVHGLKAGKTVITVKKDDKKYVADVTVSASTSQSDSITMLAGNSTSYPKIAKASEDVDYRLEISDKSVVSADDKGNVKALKAGSSDITAYKYGKIVRLNVTVKTVPTMPSTYNLNKDESATTAFKALYDSGEDVQFTSTNKNVAAFDNGIITAAGKGTATVTATYCGQAFRSTVTVYEAAIQGADTLYLGGKSEKFTATGYGNVRWYSENNSIATVDAQGSVKPVSAGKTYIHAVTGSTDVKKQITVCRLPGFSKNAYSLNKGDVVNGAFYNEGTERFSFTSSNPSAATVDVNGNLRALGRGKANITAKSATKTFKISVNVFDPVLTGPDVIYLDGKVTGLKITGGNGSTVWSSKDSRIIQTDAKGRIKGISAGTTTITAVNNGKTLTKDIQVCRVPRFTAKSYTMNTGDSLKDIFDEADVPGVTYVSSKPGVAEVDADGTVTGRSGGKTNITAYCAGKKYTANITVYDPCMVAKDNVMLTGRKSVMTIKNGVRYTEWKSSDSSVVTVNNGKLTALKKGEAVITAINNGRTMNQVITVYNTPKFDQKTYVTNLDRPLTVALTKDPEMTGVEYSVSNTKTATIDRSGLVTPLKTGSVTVNAKIAGVTYKTTVKIYDPVINGKDTVKTGKTLGLSVKNGFGPTTWTSSDNAIATVNDKGKVTGISSGTVTITAVNNGRTMTKTVTVE